MCLETVRDGGRAVKARALQPGAAMGRPQRCYTAARSNISWSALMVMMRAHLSNVVPFCEEVNALWAIELVLSHSGPSRSLYRMFY